MFMELKAYIDYKATDDELYFWRSREGCEVDFIIEKSCNRNKNFQEYL